MWLTLLVCLPVSLAQQIFSLGLTAGDASPSNSYASSYQPLLPQINSPGYAIGGGGIQPYSAAVVAPMPMYSSYPSYYPQPYGMPYQSGMMMMQQPQMPYETHRPEGPMKRFWRGAAEGVFAGGLGFLGRR